MITTLTLAFAIAVPAQVRLAAVDGSMRAHVAGAEIVRDAADGAATANVLRGHHAPPGLPALGEGSRAGALTGGRPPSKPRHRDSAVLRDAWFGNDKLRHFLMSMAVTQFAYGGLRTASAEDDVALPIAIGAAAVAGVGKELYDARRGGPFSLKDLVWDAAGITVAAFLLGAVR